MSTKFRQSFLLPPQTSRWLKHGEPGATLRDNFTRCDCVCDVASLLFLCFGYCCLQWFINWLRHAVILRLLYCLRRKFVSNNYWCRCKQIWHNVWNISFDLQKIFLLKKYKTILLQLNNLGAILTLWFL